MSALSRMARWETWVTVAGLLVLALVGVDIALFEAQPGRAGRAGVAASNSSSRPSSWRRCSAS